MPIWVYIKDKLFLTAYKNNPESVSGFFFVLNLDKSFGDFCLFLGVYSGL